MRISFSYSSFACNYVYIFFCHLLYFLFTNSSVQGMSTVNCNELMLINDAPFKELLPLYTQTLHTQTVLFRATCTHYSPFTKKLLSGMAGLLQFSRLRRLLI